MAAKARSAALLAAGMAAGLVLALPAAAPAAAPAPSPARQHAAPAADQPPECHTAELVAPSGQIAWVVACGSGPSRESPFQDWMARTVHKQLVMDGTTSIDPANCPEANPCVLIAVNTPAS